MAAKLKKRRSSKAKDRELVKPSDKDPNSLSVLGDPSKSRNVLMAETATSPVVRNAAVSRALADDVFGSMEGRDISDLDHCIKMLGDQCAAVREGNLDQATDILTAQMATLDTVFTDFLKRGVANMGQYPKAFEQYMNLAFKAQASCRNTAETLARIKRGGKQSIQITHVHTGGQAIVADTVKQGGLRGLMSRQSNNPMDPVLRLRSAPRCLATTRAGTACLCPALRGRKRCRLHGGRAGAPKGNKNAWKHGARSAETVRASNLMSAYASLLKQQGWDCLSDIEEEP